MRSWLLWSWACGGCLSNYNDTENMHNDDKDNKPGEAPAPPPPPPPESDHERSTRIQEEGARNITSQGVTDSLKPPKEK